MTQDNPPRLQALQSALTEARQALEEARQQLAQLGLAPGSSRADLERQLSAQQLAQVHAEVDAQLQEITRDARLAAAAAAMAPAPCNHQSLV